MADDSPTPDERPFHPVLGEVPLTLFDFEMTGLKPGVDQITQIAATRLVDGHIDEENSFITYVDPGMPIPPAIQEFTGITDEMVEGKPDPVTALRMFAEFSMGTVLLSHCARKVDFPFVEATLSAANVPTRPVNYIDTLQMFQAFWDDITSLFKGLDFVVARLGVSTEGIQRHDARGDTILLARTVARLQCRPELMDVFDEIPVHESIMPLPEGIDSFTD